MGLIDVLKVKKMTQFFIDNKTSLNIKMVASVGDNCEGYSTDAIMDAEYGRIKPAFINMTNAALPYSPCAGNQDGQVDKQDYPMFNKWFPVSEIQQQNPYFKGNFNGSANTYYLFSEAGMDFVVVVLEPHDQFTLADKHLDYDQASIDWANNIFTTFANRRGILISHDLFEASGYKLINDIVKKHDNMFMALCGHCTLRTGFNGQTGREQHWTETTIGGSTVHCLLSDYQSDADQGATVRYYTFKPTENKIYSYTYHVATNTYETDANSQFSFDYSMTSPIVADAPVPGKIEAENYISMLGIQTETTTDNGGGLNVGYIDTDDFMNYKVNVATSGIYQINFRVASTVATGIVQLKLGTTLLGTANISSTTGWQKWQNVSMDVPLTQGSQTLQVYASKGGFNLNWIDFISKTVTPVTGITLIPNNLSLNTGGTLTLTATILPTNASNKALTYTSNNTSIATVNSSGVVTAIAAGSTEIKAISSDNNLITCIVPVTVSNIIVSDVSLSPSNLVLNMGSSFNLTAMVSPTNATNPTVSYASSNINVALVNASGLVTSVGAGTSTITVTTIDQSKSATCVVNIKNNTILIPGKIEAENYTTMFGVQQETTSDTGAGFNVGWIDLNDWMDYTVNVETDGEYLMDFRVASASTTQATIELRTGSLILNSIPVSSTGGWQVWQTKTATVKLSSGQQTIRVYCTAAGVNINWMSFAIKTNTTPTCSITSPSTNSNLTSSPITINGIAADTDGTIAKLDFYAGTTLIGSDSSSPYSISWSPANGTYALTVIATDNTGASTTSLPISTTVNVGTCTFLNHIEAESYSNMAGVQTETTGDTGTGLDVGYLDANDWMSYNNILIPTTGLYTITYRVASLNGGGSMRMEKDAGATQLGTINIAATGGWQTWKNVSQNLTLPAGTYSIGLKIISSGFNLNWFEISCLKSATISNKLKNEKSISVFPNPINDGTFDINLVGYAVNEPIKIEILDLKGELVYSNTALMDNDGDQTIHVVTNNILVTGLYILRISSAMSVNFEKIIINH